MKTKVRGPILLFIAALIWGASFAMQSIGGKMLGPFTFSAVRLLLAALFLRVAMWITDRVGLSEIPLKKADKKRQFIVGIICGAFIAIALNLQQVALYMGVSSGKAGFLSALYILIVPIIGLFFKKKCGWNVWVGIIIALVGLYFLCVTEGFTFQLGDILLIIDAIALSFQIVTIDLYGNKVDGLRLSGMEFLFAGFITLIIALFKEIIPYPGGFVPFIQQFASLQVWGVLLFMGIAAGGIAYTLQILGQKETEPTIAALIMSIEAVFSVFAGWILLHEELSIKELIGCLLLFAAIVLAQLKFNKTKR